MTKVMGEQVSNKCCLILECSDVLRSSLDIVLFVDGRWVNTCSVHRWLHFRGTTGKKLTHLNADTEEWNKVKMEVKSIKARHEVFEQ